MGKLLCLLTCLPLLGCASFNEHHFFQSTSKATKRATNYFRLQVSGGAQFSKARYISGFYDERAVDLFFNEIKPVSGQPGDIAPIFVAGQKDPGSDVVIKPLSPDAQHGAFVMILSTNAKAVADTIGQFAENQIAADAITNLVNRDVIRQLREIKLPSNFETDQAKAYATEIDNLFALVPNGPNPDRQETERAFLRILNTTARAQGNVTPFVDFEAPNRWFREQRGRLR